ncbi:MAG: SpoIID/LytB domain-containing protein [Candidatus Obscuribacter sp.]|nr:SpoIID/LytB domain-containing protein [Candidatus Obscuribacter sp.]
MLIWVGLTNNELTGLNHTGALQIAPTRGNLRAFQGDSLLFAAQSVKVLPGLVLVAAGKRYQASAPVVFKSDSGRFQISSLRRAGIAQPVYEGNLRVHSASRSLRLSLELPLDSYMQGVLAAEMPASYHAEALKGQALCARTYALRPRLPHDQDLVNVCDSYLCCQYFAGHGTSLDPRIKAAIESTAGQVLVYEEKPILALFSSNAGGHTENYENCFSDPLTGAFPPPPLPYLKGVPEGTYPGLKAPVGSEQFLAYLYSNSGLGTKLCADNWSPKFHFHHRLTADSLEAHMHHNIEKLLADKESAPYVIPPAGGGRGRFGHIKRFQVLKRGVSGLAIELAIETNLGLWRVQKELLIRKVFENPDAGIKRLNSARIFFQQKYDKLGLLACLDVSGLGFGHGVGFQQQGAQGLSLAGMNYKQIVSHYFPGARIAQF